MFLSLDFYDIKYRENQHMLHELRDLFHGNRGTCTPQLLDFFNSFVFVFLLDLYSVTASNIHMEKSLPMQSFLAN